MKGKEKEEERQKKEEEKREGREEGRRVGGREKDKKDKLTFNTVQRELNGKTVIFSANNAETLRYP